MLNLVGFRSGRLVVLEKADKVPGGYKWKCRCDCGNITYVLGTKLKQGATRSCGCLHVEVGKTVNLQHGDSRSRLYGVWSSMKSRCLNPHNTRFKDYGGRGIKVCDEWMSYEPFMLWALDHGYDYEAEYGKLTLDRIDINGDYDPSNCRLVDLKTQSNNKRGNIYITHNGETKTLTEWARFLGINYGTFKDRYTRGVSEDKLFYQGNLRTRGI